MSSGILVSSKEKLRKKNKTKGKMTENKKVNTVLSWFRRLVAGILSLSFEFDSRPINVRFIVDKMALGKFSIGVLWLFPVTVISPIISAHSAISEALSS
jgi:hypothetical protein